MSGGVARDARCGEQQNGDAGLVFETRIFLRGASTLDMDRNSV